MIKKKNTKREYTKREYINYDDFYKNGNEMIAFVNDCMSKVADEFKATASFDAETYESYGDTGARLVFSFTRYKTNVEIAEEKAIEEKNKEYRKNKERETYEALAKKNGWKID